MSKRKKRLYNVQVLINVPVMAASASDAQLIAIAGHALYDEGNQLAQGETKPSIAGVDAVKTLDDAERLGWKSTDMPHGLAFDDETEIGDVVQ